MQVLEKRGWSLLHEKVVSKGICSGCGLCVVACPHMVLSYERFDGTGYEKPTAPEFLPSQPDYCLMREPLECVFCNQACHRLETPIAFGKSEAETSGGNLFEELELFTFGRKRMPEEDLGIYRDMVVARSVRNDALDVGPDGFGGLKIGQSFAQDGGVGTGLLVWALKKGVVDGAVTSYRSKAHPWLAEPTLATSPEEAVRCAGVHGYTYSPNTLGLLEAWQSGLKKIAYVGLPCQIESIKKMQMSLERGITDPFYDYRIRERLGAIRFTMGLICSESFTYDGLIKGMIEKGLGVKLQDINKINIKKAVLVYLKSGEVKEIRLKEAKRFARGPCKPCRDFTAELADIAVGGMGLEGWTVTIARTDTGREIMNRAIEDGFIEARSIEEFRDSGVLDLLVRTAKRHRARPSPSP